MPNPIAAEYFIGTVNNELVCHLAVTPRFNNKCYRATRLVTMPEWQGAGCGTKFLNWVCEYHKRGFGRRSHKLPTDFHTSHPQLISYLKRSKKWLLISQNLYGGLKSKSVKQMNTSKKNTLNPRGLASGYGGHFRAIQGFRYIGDGNPPKKGLL